MVSVFRAMPHLREGPGLTLDRERRVARRVLEPRLQASVSPAPGLYGISGTDCSTFWSSNTLLWFDLFTQLYSVILPRKLGSKGIPAYFRMSLFGVVSTLRFCFKGARPINIFQLHFILWFHNIPRTLALSLDFPIMVEPQEYIF